MIARVGCTVVAAGALLGVAPGCTSLGSSAVRTGPIQLAPHHGPIAVYAVNAPPGDAIGLVEVHATLQEGAIDDLMPELAQRVLELGGDAVAIDSVGARFDLVERPMTESFTYPCGIAVCTGTRFYSANDEVMTVTVRGRAFRMAGTAGAPP
jgi:hypothetical protein